MFEILRKLGVRHYDSGKKSRTVAQVRCISCGEVSEMLHQNAMKSNREGRKHCGLCITSTFHHMTHTPFWAKWQGMRWRAKDSLDKNYGGRGIEVCPEWQVFGNFYKDMYDSYSEGMTLERIDVNGPYSKQNCKWLTMFDQQANLRRTRRLVYQGEQLHLAKLVRVTGISKIMLTMRLNRGMSADEAVADAQASPYGKSQSRLNISRREKRRSTIL